MRLIGLFLFFVCVSGAVFAAPVVTPAAIPQNLHVYDSAGNTYVDLTPHDRSGVRYFLPPTHAGYEAIYSMLLAAQISKKKVILRINGCNTIHRGS